MELYNTLTDLLADARSKEREIRFIDGEKDESVLTFAELWERALELLGALQARGMSPGDELVIFSKSNESFVVAFWAAVLGGMVPVPVAVGSHTGVLRVRDTVVHRIQFHWGCNVFLSHFCDFRKPARCASRRGAAGHALCARLPNPQTCAHV